MGNVPLSALVKKGSVKDGAEKTAEELMKAAKALGYLKFDLERDDVAERMGGGLPRRSLIILKGEYGTGKSIICQRFLYGLLNNNHRVTYISSELTVKGFLDQMYTLKYNVVPYLLNDQLKFFSLHQFMGSGKQINDGLKRLEKAQNIFGDEVLIIDTLSSLAPSDIDIHQISRLLGFFKRIVANGVTVISTIETGEIDDQAMLPFYAASEVMLDLELRNTPMGQILFLNIVRFAGALKRTSPNFAFRVEPNVGIVPEITDMA